MKKRVLAVLVIAACAATSACAVNPKTQAKMERSGCTIASQIKGCNINKSYEWNQKHGFIDVQHERGHKHHARHQQLNYEQYDDGHSASGINGKFVGNYTARFANDRRSADTHIEDSGVYINGQEVRDVNQVGDVLTFRNGYAAYTIRKHGRSFWEDPDSGNRGTIVKE